MYGPTRKLVLPTKILDSEVQLWVVSIPIKIHKTTANNTNVTGSHMVSQINASNYHLSVSITYVHLQNQDYNRVTSVKNFFNKHLVYKKHNQKRLTCLQLLMPRHFIFLIKLTGYKSFIPNMCQSAIQWINCQCLLQSKTKTKFFITGDKFSWVGALNIKIFSTEIFMCSKCFSSCIIANQHISDWKSQCHMPMVSWHLVVILQHFYWKVTYT